MLAWGDQGSRLAEDFAALRLETSWVRLLTVEQLPAGGSKADWSPCTDPAQLLCRALRMAPASYCHFTVAALRPGGRLRIEAAVHCDWEARALQRDRRGTTTSFRSVGQLAAAMQRFAAAERLTVHLSADQQDILICRAFVFTC